MSANKTIATTASVQAFLDATENETRRVNNYTLLNLIQKITGHPPVLWGNSLEGFGSYHYRYYTGREGNMLLTGFSPRKQNIVIYNTGSIRYPELMNRLGKFKTGKQPRGKPTRH